MSASEYNFQNQSQTDDLCMGIIKKLGEQIEAATGTNPDAAFAYSFKASDYNHGNRSQTDDLLEEILNRIDDLGGGGGGGADGNDKIKISSNDTTSGFLHDKLGLSASEILFDEVTDGGNETLKLLAQIATRSGEQAMVGTITPDGKLVVEGDAGGDIFKAKDSLSIGKFAINENGQLVSGSGALSPGSHTGTIGEFWDTATGRRHRIGNNLRSITGRTIGIGMQFSRNSDNSYDLGNAIMTADNGLAFIGRTDFSFYSGRNATVNERAVKWDVDDILGSGAKGAMFAFGGNLDPYFRNHFYVSNKNENTSTPGYRQFLGVFEQGRDATLAGGGTFEANAAGRFTSAVAQTLAKTRNIGAIFEASGATENYSILVPETMGYAQIGVSGTDLGEELVDPTASLHLGNSANPSDQLRLHHSFTPASTADAAGETGHLAWDSNYIYLKTAAGWGRAALDFAF